MSDGYYLPTDTRLITVVLEMSPPTATNPNQPTRVFVLPGGDFSSQTYQDFKDAAEKGGSQVQIWTVRADGIESVKWELANRNRTRLD